MMKQIKAPPSLLLNPQKLARAITNGMDAEAKRVESDLAATVETWADKATFDIASPNPSRRTITTRHAVWNMLNVGTKPHIIRAKPGKVLAFRGSGFQAKTQRGVLGSSSGAKGTGSAFAKQVNHPGTEARKWDAAAAKKSQDHFAKQMQRAIDAEMS
jgi:hypothetical protein